MSYLLILIGHFLVLAAGHGQAADEHSEDGAEHLRYEVQDRVRHDVVLQAAFLVKASLCHVPGTTVLEGPGELVLFVLRVRLQVRLGCVADHAALAFLPRHVHLCRALCIAECLVQDDLVLRTGRARKPAMPNEVEIALSLGALVVVGDDHLREIIRAFLVLGVALVLHVRLILPTWLN